MLPRSATEGCAAHSGRLGGQAAGAGHGGADFHRRADSAGRRCDRDAGALLVAEGDAVIDKEIAQDRANGSAAPAATFARAATVLAAGKRLLPQDTGLAASVGIKTLPVYRKRAARAVLHRRRTGDAGRSAAAGPDLQLQPLHAERPARPPSAARCATTASCPTSWTRRARCCAAPRPRTTSSSPPAACRWATRTTSSPRWRPRARC